MKIGQHGRKGQHGQGNFFFFSKCNTNVEISMSRKVRQAQIKGTSIPEKLVQKP